MMKSGRISFWVLILGGMEAGCLFFTSIGRIQGIEAVWTGEGTTDRWADPNNWEFKQLPGPKDNIKFSSGVDWQTRQQSVTIDSVADANELAFYHFGWPTEPFHQINIEPGGQFSLKFEHIDQNYYNSTYQQIGGQHVVNGDFIYSTTNGHFEMSDGAFEVHGTLYAGPDEGTFTISGGQLMAKNLALGYKLLNGDNSEPTIDFGANALIFITGALSLEPTDAGDKLTLTLDCPLYLPEADFSNQHCDPREVTGIEQAHLVFSGSKTCELEVGGGDYGTVTTGYTENFALDILQIGDPNGGYVKLVDQINNCPDSICSGDEALYVNTLRLGSGSVLDLNGYRLYFNDLEDNGGQFVNGLPHKIGGRFLNLTWPDGKEKLISEHTYTITWQSEGDVNDVIIEYSLDNGQWWNEVSPANEGNLDSYDWQVPEVTTGQGLIRIQDANDPDVFDVSHESFWIWFAGSVNAWGRNNQGQSSVPAGKNYVAIAGGGEHSIALKGDGSLTGWGSNSYGQISTPFGTSYIAIAAGENHSLALKDNGTVVGWGDNGSGQISIPPDPNIIKAIAAGAEHSLALREDGILLGWGDNSSNQVNVPSGNDYIAITAGQTHSLALKSDGTVVGWGDNSFGQLDAPYPDSEPNQFVAIDTGDWHSIGLRKNGTIIGWGSNVYDQLEIPAGNDFLAIAAGAHHNVALRSNGTVVAWGRNTYNQTEAPAGEGYFDVAAGRYHSLALRKAKLTLLQPNGGEAWIGGKTYPITWQSLGDISEVKIEYTTDDGQTWSEVNPANTGNTGQYDWQIPEVNTDQCRVRINDTAADHISDTSDDLFTIYKCTLETDLNGDCFIDLLDLALLAADWLDCGNPFDDACQP